MLESEQRTNPRLTAMKHVETPLKPGDKAANRFQNWNHAPFVYKNPEGTHFLGPAYGVAEMAADLTAALLFALRRREEFFSRTNEDAIGQDMRVLCRRVNGTFIDLTALDPALSQAERWKIGQALYDEGASWALLSPPPGLCRMPSSFRFSMARCSAGRCKVRITALYGMGRRSRAFTDFSKGDTILRDDILAASVGKNAA